MKNSVAWTAWDVILLLAAMAPFILLIAEKLASSFLDVRIAVFDSKMFFFSVLASVMFVIRQTSKYNY